MLELNLAIIGLILSIIFSSAEIALISSNTLQIDVWIKQKYKLSNLAKSILDKKSKYLIVSLIGTNASNILCSSFATVYLINNNLISSKLVFIPITIIILLMGEILPKTIIREYSNIMLLTLSPFLRFFYVVFYPIVQILNSFNLADKKVYFNNLNEQKDKKRLEFQHLYEQVDDKKERTTPEKVLDRALIDLKNSEDPAKNLPGMKK